MRATDDLPLTPPRLPRASITGLSSWVAPRPGIEFMLAGFFSDALGLDAVGADDDFFALGGTSLQAAAIFSRIENGFRQRLPLATLYRSPTVRSLAAALERAAQTGGGRQAFDPADGTGTGSVVLIQQGSATLPLFIAPGIEGDIVGLAHVARELDETQTVYGLRSVGLLEGEEPLIGMTAIAAGFVSDIRRVQPAGPYQLFGVCSGALVMLEIASQLRAAGQEVRLLALLDPPPVSRRPLSADDSTPLSISRFVTARLGLYRKALSERPVAQWPGYIGGRLANLFDVVRRHDLLRGDRTEYLRWRVHEANLQAVRGYSPGASPGDACLIFTSERGDDASRAARDWWIRFLRAEGRTLQVASRDTGDALSAGNAGQLAAVLAPRLARKL